MKLQPSTCKAGNGLRCGFDLGGESQETNKKAFVLVPQWLKESVQQNSE